MRTLLIACGNTLRGDDGVAAEVLRLIVPAADRELCAVQQLTPEIAEKVAGYERVIFLDADAAATQLTIKPVPASVSHSQLSHASSPAEIVALATALFAFRGEAFMCGIPARDFSAGWKLTPQAQRLAREAVEELEHRFKQ
jgi:hydrogenase maturation protease